jgi:hypothetical protein
VATVSYGRGILPVPAGAHAYHCTRRGRVFVSDRSHMAESGFCLLCRPFITVSCRFCGARCPGRYDGDARCQAHREMSAEELQRLFPDAPPALVTP